MGCDGADWLTAPMMTIKKNAATTATAIFVVGDPIIGDLR
jgi:hypothetical protein